ncbi:M48 family metalloprotease [Streptomyces aureoverticillatus]|uniref:M48 family metalloprotease n=1 Tax=Streptomyces aureoverticillatus TaxID=66871 RepID=UPI0013D90D6C|nr:M48 family metalloprotease [Streptomyces aureoverticillatus]QIB47092.1 M48 family metalloprotease [Streptomyces aureoverticillatus]
MGVFVFLPLVLPLSAWPVARLAAQHLHPRAATRLLTALAAVMALCSTLCLALLMVVGTAQLPGNPLPDGWSDPEVRAALPFDEIAGTAAIPVLAVVCGALAHTVWRHVVVRRRGWRALAGLPGKSVAVVPDVGAAYAYALPGTGRGPRRGGRRARGGGGRVVVSRALLDRLQPAERRALFAHERAHLAARHHRFLLVTQLAARANPFLLPLRTATAYTAERWADEEAAGVVRDRRVVARAIGKAALAPGRMPAPVLAGLAAAGPVPRRVAALLGPAPAARTRPPLFTAVGLALWGAACGTAVSAMSSANAAVTMVLVLRAATPL